MELEQTSTVVKKHRGRIPGSKNKPKIQVMSDAEKFNVNQETINENIALAGNLTRAQNEVREIKKAYVSLRKRVVIYEQTCHIIKEVLELQSRATALEYPNHEGATNEID